MGLRRFGRVLGAQRFDVERAQVFVDVGAGVREEDLMDECNGRRGALDVQQDGPDVTQLARAPLPNGM